MCVDIIGVEWSNTPRMYFSNMKGEKYEPPDYYGEMPVCEPGVKVWDFDGWTTGWLGLEGMFAGQYYIKNGSMLFFVSISWMPYDPDGWGYSPYDPVWGYNYPALSEVYSAPWTQELEDECASLSAPVETEFYQNTIPKGLKLNLELTDAMTIAFDALYQDGGFYPDWFSMSVYGQSYYEEE